MTDPYLAIAAIATDQYMNERLNAAATQQAYLDDNGVNPQGPLTWVIQYRYVWAASPSWGEKWQYALDAHPTPEDPPYEPGKDTAVITDLDILATVQSLMGAHQRDQAAHEAPEPERVENTADDVQDENAGAPDD